MPGKKLPHTMEGYDVFLQELKDRIRQAQVRAALSVNKELVCLYWQIGRDILERQTLTSWGAKVVDKLAADLRLSFPEMKGFSPRNLKYMRALPKHTQILQLCSRQLHKYLGTHNCTILDKLKDQQERHWYIAQTIQNGWSRDVLVHQIESGLFRRQGRAITNFGTTLPEPESKLVQQLLKDPYNFEFLTLASEALEKDLERSLLEKLKDFLLELGSGFAFLGSQYHLEVGGRDFFLDLLFYHVKARCYFIVDLKVTEFEPEYVGKWDSI